MRVSLITAHQGTSTSHVNHCHSRYIPSSSERPRSLFINTPPSPSRPSAGLNPACPRCLPQCQDRKNGTGRPRPPLPPQTWLDEAAMTDNDLEGESATKKGREDVPGTGPASSSITRRYCGFLLLPYPAFSRRPTFLPLPHSPCL
jgi:hypothetical protein